MLPLPPLEESFLLGSIISPAYPAFLLPSCISGTHERGWELPGGTNPSYDHLPQGTAPGVWGGLSPMPECPCNSETWTFNSLPLSELVLGTCRSVSTKEPEVWRRPPTPSGWAGTRDSWVGRKVDVGMGTEKNSGIREFPH